MINNDPMMAALLESVRIRRLIAEKVMGYEVVATIPVGDGLMSILYTVTSRDGHATPVHSKNLPAWDENVEAAMEVVERLGLWVFPQNGRWYAGKFSGNAHVDFEYGMVEGMFRVLESDATLPQAICKAALMLAGV